MTSKEINNEKVECNNTTLKYILTPDERKRLRELSKRSDINITNADKNGSVVIQEVKIISKQQKGNLMIKNIIKCLILIHQKHVKNDQTVDRLKREKTSKENFCE